MLFMATGSAFARSAVFFAKAGAVNASSGPSTFSVEPGKYSTKFDGSLGVFA